MMLLSVYILTAVLFILFLYTLGATPLTGGFSNGAGQIWLDDIQCTGSESRLIDCSANRLGDVNCVHSDDAGVSCVSCTQGSIRLQGGTASQGRVEVCVNNTWGTVCRDSWGDNDTEVACRQLNLPIESI